MDQQHFPSLFFSLIFPGYHARARAYDTQGAAVKIRAPVTRARAHEHTPEMGALAVALP